MILTQIPAPGSHLLRHCGDTLEIILKCSQKTDGEAFLSTNVGNAVLRRSEIIKYVEEREPVSGQDWANLKMNRVDDYTFQICLAL